VDTPELDFVVLKTASLSIEGRILVILRKLSELEIYLKLIQECSRITLQSKCIRLEQLLFKETSPTIDAKKYSPQRGRGLCEGGLIESYCLTLPGKAARYSWLGRMLDD